jgi:hypothetical protein
MTQDELQANKQAGNFKPDPGPKEADFELPQGQGAPDSLDEFLPLLVTLRMPRRTISTAPTFIPKTFIDSIQFYENGTTRRLYLFIGSAWRYCTLT